MHMAYQNYSNEELITLVRSSTSPTPLEELLATRLAEAVDIIDDLEHHRFCDTCGECP